MNANNRLLLSVDRRMAAGLELTSTQQRRLAETAAGPSRSQQRKQNRQNSDSIANDRLVRNVERSTASGRPLSGTLQIQLAAAAAGSSVPHSSRPHNPPSASQPTRSAAGPSDISKWLTSSSPDSNSALTSSQRFGSRRIPQLPSNTASTSLGNSSNPNQEKKTRVIVKGQGSFPVPIEIDSSQGSDKEDGLGMSLIRRTAFERKMQRQSHLEAMENAEERRDRGTGIGTVRGMGMSGIGLRTRTRSQTPVASASTSTSISTVTTDHHHLSIKQSPATQQRLNRVIKPLPAASNSTRRRRSVLDMDLDLDLDLDLEYDIDMVERSGVSSATGRKTGVVRGKERSPTPMNMTIGGMGGGQRMSASASSSTSASGMIQRQKSTPTGTARIKASGMGESLSPTRRFLPQASPSHRPRTTYNSEGIGLPAELDDLFSPLSSRYKDGDQKNGKGKEKLRANIDSPGHPTPASSDSSTLPDATELLLGSLKRKRGMSQSDDDFMTKRPAAPKTNKAMDGSSDALRLVRKKAQQMGGGGRDTPIELGDTSSESAWSVEVLDMQSLEKRPSSSSQKRTVFPQASTRISRPARPPPFLGRPSILPAPRTLPSSRSGTLVNTRANIVGRASSITSMGRSPRKFRAAGGRSSWLSEPAKLVQRHVSPPCESSDPGERMKPLLSDESIVTDGERAKDNAQAMNNLMEVVRQSEAESALAGNTASQKEPELNEDFFDENFFDDDLSLGLAAQPIVQDLSDSIRIDAEIQKEPLVPIPTDAEDPSSENPEETAADESKSKSDLLAAQTQLAEASAARTAALMARIREGEERRRDERLRMLEQRAEAEEAGHDSSDEEMPDVAQILASAMVKKAGPARSLRSQSIPEPSSRSARPRPNLQVSTQSAALRRLRNELQTDAAFDQRNAFLLTQVNCSEEEGSSGSDDETEESQSETTSDEVADRKLQLSATKNDDFWILLRGDSELASASSVSLIPRLDSDYGCFSAFCGGKILDARGLRLAILSDRVNAAQIPSDLLCKMTVEAIFYEENSSNLMDAVTKLLQSPHSTSAQVEGLEARLPVMLRAIAEETESRYMRVNRWIELVQAMVESESITSGKVVASLLQSMLRLSLGFPLDFGDTVQYAIDKIFETLRKDDLSDLIDAVTIWKDFELQAEALRLIGVNSGTIKARLAVSILKRKASGDVPTGSRDLAESLDLPSTILTLISSLSSFLRIEPADAHGINYVTELHKIGIVSSAFNDVPSTVETLLSASPSGERDKEVCNARALFESVETILGEAAVQLGGKSASIHNHHLPRFQGKRRLMELRDRIRKQRTYLLDKEKVKKPVGQSKLNFGRARVLSPVESQAENHVAALGEGEPFTS